MSIEDTIFKQMPQKRYYTLGILPMTQKSEKPKPIKQSIRKMKEFEDVLLV